MLEKIIVSFDLAMQTRCVARTQVRQATATGMTMKPMTTKRLLSPIGRTVTNALEALQEHARDLLSTWAHLIELASATALCRIGCLALLALGVMAKNGTSVYTNLSFSACF